MNDPHSSLSVETHGIEFVPEEERYGSAARLFTIWISINLSIVCLTVGTLGIFAGLGLGWTFVALILGNGTGTVFMAAHSAQGPHLGVPQMIQSRAQFGVLGAALPLIAVVLTYILYTAADGIVVRDTMRALLGVGNTPALVLFGAITLVIAFVGYELIHRLGVAMAVVSGLLFFGTTVILVMHGPSTPPTPPSAHPFVFPAFMLTVTQSAAWSLSFGPYVADYSRYLPKSTSTRGTFWCTGLGNFLGATLVMCLGAYIASAHAAIARDPGTGIANLFGSGAYAVRLLIALGVLEGNVMNLYSAYMSSVTIFSGVKSMTRVRLSTKLVLMTSLIAIATLIAVVYQDHFDTYFGDMLSVLVYILVPWSAINLTDYYLVRKGRYVIADLYRIDGIYGRIRWRVICVYVFCIILQIPFIQLSFYSGDFAKALGADIAWIPGLIISAILYWTVERWTHDRRGLRTS